MRFLPTLSPPLSSHSCGNQTSAAPQAPALCASHCRPWAPPAGPPPPTHQQPTHDSAALSGGPSPPSRLSIPSLHLIFAGAPACFRCPAHCFAPALVFSSSAAALYTPRCGGGTAACACPQCPSPSRFCCPAQCHVLQIPCSKRFVQLQKERGKERGRKEGRKARRSRGQQGTKRAAAACLARSLGARTRWGWAGQANSVLLGTGSKHLEDGR